MGKGMETCAKEVRNDFPVVVYVVLIFRILDNVVVGSGRIFLAQPGFLLSTTIALSPSGSWSKDDR